MCNGNDSLYLEETAAWLLNCRMILISAYTVFNRYAYLEVSIRFWRSGDFFQAMANPKTHPLTSGKPILKNASSFSMISSVLPLHAMCYSNLVRSHVTFLVFTINL